MASYSTLYPSSQNFLTGVQCQVQCGYHLYLKRKGLQQLCCLKGLSHHLLHTMNGSHSEKFWITGLSKVSKEKSILQRGDGECFS